MKKGLFNGTLACLFVGFICAAPLPASAQNDDCLTIDYIGTENVFYSYQWPTATGAAKISEHYRVFIKAQGEDVERELQVLQSDPIVNNIKTNGTAGEDHMASYTKRRTFSFVPISYDDSKGKSLTLRVVSLDNYKGKALISPKSYGYTATTDNGEAVFEINQANQYLTVNFNCPGNIVAVDVNGPNGSTNTYNWIKNMLCIYVDPVETLKPNPATEKVVYFSSEITEAEIASADVVYFRPGYYNLKDTPRGQVINDLGGLTLTANQKIYVAGGAFIDGYILRKNYNDKNQVIYGRGIISGRQYTWQPGNSNRDISQLVIIGANSTVDGVILMESPHHGLVARNDCNINNVKFLGWHCNNDGFRPGNNTKVSHCFMRACDDFFYNYRLDIDDCVLWPCFNGSIMTNGWSGIDIGGSDMRNVDIIYPEWTSMGNNKGLIMSQNSYAYNPPADSPTTVFSDIRFEGKIPGFVNLKPNSDYDDGSKEALTDINELGWMGDILLENVSIEEQVGEGTRGMRTNLIKGAKGETVVTGHPEAVWWVKNITFKNLTISGEKITDDNQQTYFNIDADTTENIVFE